MSADNWLRGVNVDEELVATRDNIHEVWEVRALAGASVGIDPIAGLAELSALGTAVDAVVRQEASGRAALAEILGRGSDYQRCLWFSLAGRDPFSVASALTQLRDLMEARAEMWLSAQRAGHAPVTYANPYHAAAPEGPRGIYDPDFCLGIHWEGIADG